MDQDRSPAIPTLRAIRANVEQHLSHFVHETKERWPAPGGSDAIDPVIKALGSGGKRLRPVLTVVGHLVAGGSAEGSILATAGAWELLHTMALIHDDIMDSSAKRRGRPSLHVTEGIAGAVLTGDLAHALADELFLSASFDSALISKAGSFWNRAKLDTAVGQSLDLSISPQDVTPEIASEIARLKTASYSTVGPLQTGAALGGAPEELLNAVSQIGVEIGVAFQFLNDLEGFGPEGGQVDVLRGSPSILLAESLERSDEAGRRLLTSMWGRPSLTTDEVSAVTETIDQSGASEAVASRVSTLVGDAARRVRLLPDNNGRSLLEEVLETQFGLENGKAD